MRSKRCRQFESAQGLQFLKRPRAQSAFSRWANKKAGAETPAKEVEEKVSVLSRAARPFEFHRGCGPPAGDHNPIGRQQHCRSRERQEDRRGIESW